MNRTGMTGEGTGAFDQSMWACCVGRWHACEGGADDVGEERGHGGRYHDKTKVDENGDERTLFRDGHQLWT